MDVGVFKTGFTNTVYMYCENDDPLPDLFCKSTLLDFSVSRWTVRTSYALWQGTTTPPHSP